MAEGFRASEEDWKELRRGSLGTYRCILELADRIAALEQVQQQAAEPTQQAKPVKNYNTTKDLPQSHKTSGNWLVDDKPLGHKPQDLIELVDEAVPASAEQQASAQAASPAPAGGLVGELKQLLNLYYSSASSSRWRAVFDDFLAGETLLLVAKWMESRTSTIANGSQWADMLRLEADR